MIDKKALIEAVARKLNVGDAQAQSVVNEIVAELVSPAVFARPGEKVGFINDNHCTNNCKEELALRDARR
jgi:nucleoid DNA-binding protein